VLGINSSAVKKHEQSKKHCKKQAYIEVHMSAVLAEMWPPPLFCGIAVYTGHCLICILKILPLMCKNCLDFNVLGSKAASTWRWPFILINCRR
jgi:hypothetical protein